MRHPNILTKAFWQLGFENRPSFFRGKYSNYIKLSTSYEQAYHGVNFAAPFIIMRHWNELKKDGDFWCGAFGTDEIDQRLAELIVNIQFACQKHYFGAMAEKYFDDKTRDAAVNRQRQQKTIDAFNRLPEEFTYEDVMRCFSLVKANTARMESASFQRR